MGFNPNNTYGVPMPCLRTIAKEIGTDHALALELWASGIHEARIVAGLIADHKTTTEEEMDCWAGDLDS